MSGAAPSSSAQDQRAGRSDRAAHAGWDVTVFEAGARPGDTPRTEELTLPGVLHDVCSAIHPLRGRVAGVP